MSTLAELIDRVINRLSMVSGTGVQIYAEDRIAEMIQHKFDVLFDEEYWPQFTTWSTFALDGTLGLITTDVTELIKKVDDIQVIFPEGSERALTKLSGLTRNPNLLSGTQPLHYEALSSANALRTSRVFNVWPKTATGNLNVRYRTKPDNFVATDTVDFDDQALILGAAYDYLEDDGTNPNATQKFQAMFDSRVSQLKDNHNSAPISLDHNQDTQYHFGFSIA